MALRDDFAGAHLQGGEQCRGGYSHAALEPDPSARAAGCGPAPALATSRPRKTTACSGGFRYKPTISRTFSTKNGSFDNLNVWPVGLDPEGAQQTVLWETPSVGQVGRPLAAPAGRYQARDALVVVSAGATSGARSSNIQTLRIGPVPENACEAH